ncbi:MAG: imidazole glycerol phosphate synthase subunit HisH [Candidatus Omnitrophica bacterium]|nr:imidazole glycerol phosphate synthase subunit HisH [Candidatus Omnitrophota bacterium]
MIAIIDYGMGNLRSVQKALEHAGAKTVVTQNKDDILKAAKVVLPGVGAMKPAMEKLQNLDLISTINDVIHAKRPFLGICLGLQLLFESSDEGNVKGLGILKGRVLRFTQLKIPHMGWNQLRLTKTKGPLFKNIKDGTNVYFCHSYYVQPEDEKIICAQTDYGLTFTAAIHADNIYAVQFHPEKSQTIGLSILKNFLEVKS